MTHIAIVGAGFSGTALALHLVRLSAERSDAVTVSLIDPRPVGQGVAYGTSLPDHLLNVPARGMSMFPDQPDDFLRWWAAEQHGPHHLDADHLDVHRLDFAPRAAYARYLAGHFAALGGAVTHYKVAITKAAITKADRHGQQWHLQTDDQNIAIPPCDHLVLALGNDLPQPTAFGFTDPWHITRQLDPTAPAFIMGTGLTMIDAVMSLAANGHSGPVLALSRRGLVPRAHDLAAFARPALPPPHSLIGMSPRDVLRWIRRTAQDVGEWRLAVDALRSITPSLWQAWTAAQKQQFLRHLQSRWDVHRHRMAPQIADKLRDWQQTGRLRIVAGRIQAVSGSAAQGWHISWHLRGRASAVQTTQAGIAIDCSGRRTDPVAGQKSSFIAGLLAAELVRPDGLRLGFDQHDHRLVGASGQAHPALWAVGPIVRGANWENTAVPELRNEAVAVAQKLLAS